MIKPTRLVPANAIREILSPDDADRMLKSGSWVETRDKVSAVAIRQRQHRRKRKLLGFKRFTAYLPPELFELLDLQRLDGEDNASLLSRLLRAGVTNSR